MFDECEMTEDVLVRHLDAERSLRADATHSVPDVDRPNVGETLRADVHRDERSCDKIKVLIGGIMGKGGFKRVLIIVFYFTITDRNRSV